MVASGGLIVGDCRRQMEEENKPRLLPYDLNKSRVLYDLLPRSVIQL
jgi:hypothetical protein